MKGLYCVSNGYYGESYVRVYVWANDGGEAIELAQAALKKDDSYSAVDADYHDIMKLQVKFLFSADSPSFCTMPSDSGFEME